MSLYDTTTAAVDRLNQFIPVTKLSIPQNDDMYPEDVCGFRYLWHDLILVGSPFYEFVNGKTQCTGLLITEHTSKFRYVAEPGPYHDSFLKMADKNAKQYIDTVFLAVSMALANHLDKNRVWFNLPDYSSSYDLGVAMADELESMAKALRATAALTGLQENGYQQVLMPLIDSVLKRVERYSKASNAVRRNLR